LFLQVGKYNQGGKEGILVVGGGISRDQRGVGFELVKGNLGAVWKAS